MNYIYFAFWSGIIFMIIGYCLICFQYLKNKKRAKLIISVLIVFSIIIAVIFPIIAIPDNTPSINIQNIRDNTVNEMINIYNQNYSNSIIIPVIPNQNAWNEIRLNQNVNNTTTWVFEQAYWTVVIQYYTNITELIYYVGIQFQSPTVPDFKAIIENGNIIQYEIIEKGNVTNYILIQ